MRKLDLVPAFILFGLLFAGCADEEADRVKTVEMTIYPETGYGAAMMSDIWTQPLLFSDSDDNEERMMLDIITEGFDIDYERGYEYKLNVEKIWMREPPQDVSSIKYVFIELVSKEKVITQDTEETLELFVSPETVKFTPKYPSAYEDDHTPKIYDALKVKTTGSDSWIILPEIEGFDFESGFEYKLSVNKIVQAEPYSVRYVLRDVMTKEEKK